MYNKITNEVIFVDSKSAFAEDSTGLTPGKLFVSIVLLPLLPFVYFYRSRKLGKTLRATLMVVYFVLLLGIYQYACVKQGKPIRRIDVESSKIVMKSGETEMLEYTVVHESTKITETAFTTSNDKSVRVNSKGKLTAIAPGRADIKITVTDNHYTSREKKITVAVVE